jgi:hypothetical protein
MLYCYILYLMFADYLATLPLLATSSSTSSLSCLVMALNPSGQCLASRPDDGLGGLDMTVTDQA